MNMQEYFDKTIRHLHQQGRPAVGADGSCSFLTEDGLRCAVGFHLPATLDVEQIGGSCLAALPDILKGIAWPETADGYELAYQLQDLHDEQNIDSAFLNWGPTGFIGWDAAREIAHDFDLKTTVIDELEVT